jgi:hypothetical protein
MCRVVCCGAGTLEELVYRRQVYKQQQSNMVLEGKQEARYWEGVQVRRLGGHNNRFCTCQEHGMQHVCNLHTCCMPCYGIS